MDPLICHIVLSQVIMPGYCVQGTVGHKILNGAKKIDFENRTSVEVNLSVEVRNLFYSHFPLLASSISSLSIFYIPCLKWPFIPFNLVYTSAMFNVDAFITSAYE